MRAADIAARLREQCPSLRQVLPAAAGAEPTTWPAAYVLLLARSAAPNSLVSGLHSQWVTYRYAIDVIVRSARETATGGPAADLLLDVLDEIDQALAGWTSDDAWEPIALEEGQLVAYAPGECTWRQVVRTATILRT